jgi:hypothetical protein
MNQSGQKAHQMRKKLVKQVSLESGDTVLNFDPAEIDRNVTQSSFLNSSMKKFLRQ